MLKQLVIAVHLEMSARTTLVQLVVSVINILTNFAQQQWMTSLTEKCSVRGLNERQLMPIALKCAKIRVHNLTKISVNE